MGAKKSGTTKKAVPVKGRNAAAKKRDKKYDELYHLFLPKRKGRPSASKKTPKTSLVPGRSPNGQLMDEKASEHDQKTSLVPEQSPSGQLMDDPAPKTLGGPWKGCIDYIITTVTGCFRVQKTSLGPEQSPSGQLMDGGPRKGCIDYIITPVTGCFFFFNFIFFVTGITILAVCAVAYSLPETADAYNGLDEPGSNNDFSISGFREKAMISLMVGGSIVMLVGFLGCFGVSIGNSVLIYMYGMLLAIMVMLQLASLVFIYENKDEMIKRLPDKLTKMVKEYQAYNNTDDAAMNLIQQFNKCCGVRSGRDYTTSVWFNRTRLPNQRVPLSCCQLRYGPNGTTIPVNPRCQFGLISRNNPFTDQGCNAAIKRNIFSSGVTAVGLMMGVTLVQLLAICGAAIIERHYLDQDLAHKASRRDITFVEKNDVEDQIKKEHKASYTPIYSVM